MKSQHGNPLLFVLLASACALLWAGSFGLSGEGSSPFRGADPVSDKAASPVPADVLARAQAEIAAREYWASESERGLQAPNRAHALRTYFAKDGIRVVDRIVDDQPELVRMRLVGLGRGASIGPVPVGDVVARENRVEIARPRMGVVEWYENSPGGLEQGFTLAERPSPADGELRDSRSLVLEIAVEGAVAESAGAAIDLRTNAGRFLRYDKLLVVDAVGTILAARFEVPNTDRIRILVEDAEATYPVVIDPLLTASFDGEIESNQVGAQLGHSAAGAGDVNGDGFADVIVGAPAFDAGQSDEGAAFVYLGGPGGGGVVAGNPVNAHAQLESNQAGVRFGWSVASAGDVNGDGFADVIVGSPSYTADSDSEGAAFVFLGSAAGIADGSPATAHAELSGDQTDAFVDLKVASAGDLDADGFDDVVLGAPEYPRNGPLGWGGVFVFMGSAAGLADATVASADATISPGIVAGTSLGSSVGSAGDVNGDGYDDLVVGASGASAQQGAAAVFHGSASGLANTTLGSANTLIESGQLGAFLGGSVASLGDVNGDGYGDIVVGAIGYDAGGLASDLDEGVAFVFLGSATGIESGSAGLAHAQLQANQGSASFGSSVAGAGDVNGDGYSDVIVGAMRYDAGQTDEGAVFVFLGSSDGVSDGSPASAYAQLESNQANAQLGLSVAGAGDVDGDGYADVVAGAHLYAAGQSGEGAAFVYRGGAMGLSDVAGGSANALLESNQSLAWMGESVASAGDVNADGYSDVIVGAPFYDAGEADEGAAFVYLGSPAGIQGGGPLAADALLESNQAGAQLGASVATAGDVNGDGYADVIVGAPDFSIDSVIGPIREGSAFVFLGSSSGISSGGVATAHRALRAAQNALTPRFNPLRFGISVGSAGDLDGDGYGDLVVGAPGFDAQGFDGGAVYVYHGSSAGIADSIAEKILAFGVQDAELGASVGSAGDVDGDGYGDIIAGAPGYWFQNGDPNDDRYGAAFVWKGSATGILGNQPSGGRLFVGDFGSRFGARVASAGDVDGDGFDDVVVGAPNEFGGVGGEGAAYVFYGSVLGVGQVVPDLNVRHSYLLGDQAGAAFGSSVASAGDLDDDGFSEIVVGAPLYDAPETNEGAAFVFAGSILGIPSSGPAAATVRLESNQATAELGRSAAPAGDVDGDGRADLIVGAPFLGAGTVNEGAALVYSTNSQGSLKRAVLPIQRRGDGSGIAVQPWGRAESETQFVVALSASHPQGLGRVRAQVEACPAGVVFGQPGCTTAMSPSWIALAGGAPDVSLATPVTGLVPETLYRWRARVLHAPADGTIPTNPEHGPWRRLGGQAANAGIRTVPEPVVGVALAIGATLLGGLGRGRSSRRNGWARRPE